MFIVSYIVARFGAFYKMSRNHKTAGFNALPVTATANFVFQLCSKCRALIGEKIMKQGSFQRSSDFSKEIVAHNGVNEIGNPEAHCCVKQDY